MNDRELLENAAKAVEINWVRVDDVWYDKETGRTHNWNPLTDNGDALRLAVKLDLFWENIDMHFDSRILDKGEATRLAIVKAAAEIGKQQ